MEFAPGDYLGDVAQAINARGLARERGGARVKVALQAGVSEAELRAFLGDNLRLHAASASSWIAEFDASQPTGQTIASARARAVLAAAMACSRPPTAPRIMGVLNVTPDSFSDGGQWIDPARALDRGLEMIAQGAAVLDIGGESSRPGATSIDLEVERRRVLPVVRALAQQTKIPLSIDTTKARLAEEALDLGATVVNDISAGRLDPQMIPLIARSRCEFVLMHMQGTPLDMQRAPAYTDVLSEVVAFLRERAGFCWRAGIASERLWIDPGLGFGKTLEHNLELIARLFELRSLGLRILVGPSRKSFIAQAHARQAGAMGTQDSERIGGTAAALTACVFGGAELLRVHDVELMSEAASVAWAVCARGARTVT